MVVAMRHLIVSIKARSVLRNTNTLRTRYIGHWEGDRTYPDTPYSLELGLFFLIGKVFRRDIACFLKAPVNANILSNFESALCLGPRLAGRGVI